MSANLDTVSQIAERLTKLAGLVAFAYVLAMGVAYRAGTKLGRRAAGAERKQAGKPVLSGLSTADSPSVFWKDDALIQGGLKGLVIMVILSIYVGGMLLALPPSAGELAPMTAILLAFPNLMALFFIVLMSRPLKLHAAGTRKAVLAASIVVALASLGVIALVVVRVFADKSAGMTFVVAQVFMVTVQSAFLSHLYGVDEGIYSANFEKRLPAVSVLTADGGSRDDLRLLKATESDYRFVDADGAECLIPREQIRMVRAKPQ